MKLRNEYKDYFYKEVRVTNEFKYFFSLADSLVKVF